MPIDESHNHGHLLLPPLDLGPYGAEGTRDKHLVAVAICATWEQCEPCAEAAVVAVAADPVLTLHCLTMGYMAALGSGMEGVGDTLTLSVWGALARGDLARAVEMVTAADVGSRSVMVAEAVGTVAADMSTAMLTVDQDQSER